MIHAVTQAFRLENEHIKFRWITDMPVVNTADLVGPALDYVMATLEELPIRHDPMAFGNTANGGYWVWPDAKGQGIPHMKIGPNPNCGTIARWPDS